MAWNPAQYLKFEAPRLRPALDLLARVPLPDPRRVVDLGCGTGNTTALLAERWPDAEVSGVDASATMLAKAAADQPQRRWIQADLADWQPDAAAPPDLVYSNAALHWLPDHPALFARLASGLRPGGVLAVQMPRNFNEPSHTLMAETIAAGPWRQRLAPMLQPSPVAEPAAYFDWLEPFAADLQIWQTDYLQVLSGPDPVKEWTKGTWLMPFLQALASDDERVAFEADYAQRLSHAYPMRADGRTLFPFKRVFIVMIRR